MHNCTMVNLIVIIMSVFKGDESKRQFIIDNENWTITDN